MQKNVVRQIKRTKICMSCIHVEHLVRDSSESRETVEEKCLNCIEVSRLLASNMQRDGCIAPQNRTGTAVISFHGQKMAVGWLFRGCARLNGVLYETSEEH